MMLFLMWSSAALAADGTSSLFLPGAAPLEGGHGSVGALAAGAVSVDVSVAAVGVEAAVAVTDRLTVSLMGGRVSYGAFNPLPPHPLLVGGVSWLLVDQPNVRVAPILVGADDIGGKWGAMAGGLALELQASIVRLDLEVPAFGLQAGTNNTLGTTWFPLAADAGLAVALGPHNELRAALTGLSWSIRTKHVYMDLTGAYVGGIAASMKLGARF